MKTRIALIGLLVLGALGCSTIDIALSTKADIKQKMNKVAVFPFDIKGSSWGDEFSDCISHHFFKSGRIEVIEREAIERILKEQNLSMSGLVDDGGAVKIGKLLGADVIIIGRGSALRIPSKSGEEPNLVDTFSIKGIRVENGDLLFTVRKEPGIAWDWRYRMKYCCSGTLIWGRRDVLVQSSRYDDISRQVVKKVFEALDALEKEKSAK